MKCFVRKTIRRFAPELGGLAAFLIAAVTNAGADATLAIAIAILALLIVFVLFPDERRALREEERLVAPRGRSGEARSRGSR